MKDLRERQFVSKLDRYLLEDKYLRLLEEMESLKKQSNEQEDKIKRLGTKLIRVSTNPSACINLHNIYNDKEKIAAMEYENNKLKNRVNVLRNQLLSHVNQRKSPKRYHRDTTVRTSYNESIRQSNVNTKLKIASSSQHLMENNGTENNYIEEHVFKIQELETEKKEMAFKILKLENELENHDTENQKTKIADNIKHIRNLRYIKECTGKLVVFENENKCLKAEIDDLKKLVTDARRINKEVTSLLMIEKKKTTEMDLKVLTSKDFDLSLREKDEQIQDLMNEIKILQQHNSELIALSNKYSNIKVENAQLTKKISDQMNNNQILKNALNNEQANTSALQTANSQLLLKLNQLQRTMDTLTIQLTTFEEKPTKQEILSNNFFKEQYQKCCSNCENSYSDTFIINKTNDYATVQEEQDINLGIEKESQTENSYLQESQSLKKENNISIQRHEESDGSNNMKNSERKKVQDINRNSVTIHNGNNELSPERMLKLLEQAQITTTLELQKTKSKQVDPLSESVQKQRQVINLETLLFGDSSFF